MPAGIVCGEIRSLHTGCNWRALIFDSNNQSITIRKSDYMSESNDSLLSFAPELPDNPTEYFAAICDKCYNVCNNMKELNK